MVVVADALRWAWTGCGADGQDGGRMRSIGTLLRDQPEGDVEPQTVRDGPLPNAIDVGLALIMTALVLAEASGDSQRGMSPALLLMTLPLAWRRRQPLLVFGLAIVGAVLANRIPPYAGIFALMIAAYSVGAYGRNWLLSLGLMFGTATAVSVTFGGALPPVPDFAGPYIVVIPLWLAGHAIRTRQLRADAFEDKAMRLEQEQELARQAAMAAERARIARELHDVVAHSVSVMVVQAGAARHIVQTAPGQATEALRAVESSGREAMAELRRLLGVLSHDGEEGPEGAQLAPQPGVEQLAALVRRVGNAGLPVDLRIEGRPQPLPSGVNLTVYRIVQEALTNALRYAGLARTEVILDYRDVDLKVEILDEGTGAPWHDDAGHGHGLAGMRERVALYGGTLEAGPRLERGFAVRAWLPLEIGCPGGRSLSYDMPYAGK